MKTSFKTISTVFTIAIICVSCAVAPEVGLTEDKLYERPMPLTEYEYLLGPGDVIEIVYHYTAKAEETNAYRLAAGDVISVEFLYHPDYNRELTVRPDGSISLPRVGDLRVLDLTPDQARQKIAEAFSNTFREPIVNVYMVKYNRAIEHLKEAIKTAPRGQSKLTTLRPDGYVSFPMISDVLAGGKTLSDLKSVVQDEYDKLIDNLTVTLILKNMNSNLVYVFGEVGEPQVLLMQRPETVSQVVARAGGVLDSAETSTVLLISSDEKRRPWGRIVDLEKVIYDGDISKDVVVKQYDVVFVPKSRIARANLFVEQYINRMIPRSVSFSFGYDLGGVLIDTQPVIH